MNDYHLHTSLCKHAEGKLQEYVDSAIEKGITEICFTDHIPLPDNFDIEHRMSFEELDSYFTQIDSCRVKNRGITILTGIEADYIEGYEDYLDDFISQYPFDMVIMSIHFLKKWKNNQWVFSYEYTDETIKSQYKDYFDAMVKGIKTGLFDIVGHFDLIKRLQHPVMATNSEDVERVLNAVLKTSMSIELNASGLRKFIKETYPSMDILGLAVDKKIPIVLSSDAHKPADVGYEFDDLFNQLFNFPTLQLASYRNRQATNRFLIPQYE